MVLHNGQLFAGSKLKTLFNELLYAAYVINALPGSVVLRLLGQEIRGSDESETLVLSVLYTAKLQEPTAVDAVKDHLVELAAPLVARGFTLDVAASSAEAVVVDATVAYACGGGSLCFSGDRCDWDSDCADGHCNEDNVCGYSSSEISLWKLLLGIFMVVFVLAIIAALLIYRFVWLRSLPHTKLLEEPREVNMGDIPPTSTSISKSTSMSSSVSSSRKS
jgi:hypothetical protein